MSKDSYFPLVVVRNEVVAAVSLISLNFKHKKYS